MYLTLDLFLLLCNPVEPMVINFIYAIFHWHAFHRTVPPQRCLLRSAFRHFSHNLYLFEYLVIKRVSTNTTKFVSLCLLIVHIIIGWIYYLKPNLMTLDGREIQIKYMYCSMFFFRRDNSGHICYNVVRKLVEFQTGGANCSDHLYLQSGGIQLSGDLCNDREREAWNQNTFKLCYANVLEIDLIYKTRRPSTADGKFWIQIEGTLGLKVAFYTGITSVH